MRLLGRYEALLHALLAELEPYYGRRLGARRVHRGNAWYWELKPDLEQGEIFTL